MTTIEYGTLSVFVHEFRKRMKIDHGGVIVAYHYSYNNS